MEGGNQAICRTKEVAKMTRGNSSMLKVREMERREQGGLESHISFRMLQEKTIFLCKISVKQTYKIAPCLHN